MLSFGFWQRKFGGDRSVIGKTITIEGELRQVIGVLPRDFHSADGTSRCSYPCSSTALTLSSRISAMNPSPGLSRESHWRKPTRDVARMLPIVQKSFPMPVGLNPKTLEDARIGPNLRTLKQEVVGDMDKVLWVLMGA